LLASATVIPNSFGSQRRSSLRTVRFLVPGTTGRFRCGGLLVELQTARLLQSIAAVEVVTYRQREEEHPFLADLLKAEPPTCGHDQPLWIVSWGFEVPAQLRRLRGRALAYHAHSSGYGFDLPSGVPVLAVSRNTLGYWGDRAPRNPLYLLPNALEAAWMERGDRSGALPRSIDVLVQQRKSSAYVLERLVPALRARGLKVEVQSGWVDDLVDLFNQSTVYLYDSADYWRSYRVSEGFGLPPIEALACGCVVFSSLNHALADNLDPAVVGHQIGAGTLAADVEAISSAVADPAAWRLNSDALEAVLHPLSEAVLLERWRRVLTAVDQHWQRLSQGERPLVAPAPRQVRWHRRWLKLRRLLRR